MHAVDESEDSDDQAEDPHLTEETPGEAPVEARMDVDNGGSDTVHEGP